MQRAQGFAEQGAQVVWTAGIASTTLVQASAPYATIRVYLTGTTTLATLFSDNQPTPTPMANPFTANEFGYWFFYAADGRYDVMIEAEDWTWTIGDLLLRGLEGLTMNNGVCKANITFDANCSIVITGNNGQLLASLNQQGDLQITGCMKWARAGVPSMSMCLDSSGSLNFLNDTGVNLGYINQGGLWNVFKLIAQQIEGVESIWSLGSLGSDKGIESHGAIAGPVVDTELVQAHCVQLRLGSGPTITLCADASGTLQITNDGGVAVASLTQGGLLTTTALVADAIEGKESVWSLALLGTTRGGTVNIQATGEDGLQHWYHFEDGILVFQP